MARRALRAAYLALYAHNKQRAAPCALAGIESEKKKRKSGEKEENRRKNQQSGVKIKKKWQSEESRKRKISIK